MSTTDSVDELDAPVMAHDVWDKLHLHGVVQGARRIAIADTVAALRKEREEAEEARECTFHPMTTPYAPQGGGYCDDSDSHAVAGWFDDSAVAERRRKNAKSVFDRLRPPPPQPKAAASGGGGRSSRSTTPVGRNSDNQQEYFFHTLRADSPGAVQRRRRSHSGGPTRTAAPPVVDRLQKLASNQKERLEKQRRLSLGKQCTFTPRATSVDPSAEAVKREKVTSAMAERSTARRKEHYYWEEQQRKEEEGAEERRRRRQQQQRSQSAERGGTTKGIPPKISYFEQKQRPAPKPNSFMMQTVQKKPVSKKELDAQRRPTASSSAKQTTPRGVGGPNTTPVTSSHHHHPYYPINYSPHRNQQRHQKQFLLKTPPHPHQTARLHRDPAMAAPPPSQAAPGVGIRNLDPNQQSGGRKPSSPRSLRPSSGNLNHNTTNATAPATIRTAGGILVPFELPDDDPLPEEDWY